MTNLLPRLQFRTPGLNRNVTPTANTTIPKDNGKIHKRLPNQETQSRASFTKNAQVQKQRHYSISLYNEHETHTDTESFRSNIQRPRTMFPVQTAVNQKRHTSCTVSIDPVEFSPGMTTYIQRQRSLVSQRINMIFNNPGKLSRTKLNLYRAERTYSSRNLIELKRKQYIQRLNQNRRAFQGDHGNQEYLYLKYMRYINQSKTVPLPSKSGWKRPKWPPKLVTRGESTKDNSQKQRTTDKKVCSSSNVLQKSHSDKFGKSKPEIKTQTNTEMQKHKSSKELVFTDQAVNVIRRPQRSKPSFMRSPNGPSKSPRNLGSQERTENREDVQSKDELKDAVETSANVERENYDKHLSSGDKNQQRQTITKEEVDIPMSLPGHVSPKGSIHDTMHEEDCKSIDFEQRKSTDEMNKKSKEHGSRLSAVERPESKKSTRIKDHEKMQDEDQTSNDFEHREFADDMNKKSQEHDSPPLAVESPESKKNNSSKVLDTLQEKDQMSTDLEQRESADEINKRSQEHDSHLSTIGRPDSGNRSSTNDPVHEPMQEDDQKSTGLEQREHVEEMNKKRQEHSSHSSSVERPESGKENSTNVPVKLQEDEKATELKQRESADEMDRTSQEHNNRCSPAESPDLATKISNGVPVKLQEEEKKSTELEQGESADEMDRNSQEHDNRDSPAERPDLAKKTSNEVPVKLQEEEKKSTELEQGESADEMDRNSQEHDNCDSPAERPDLAKKTSNEVPVKLQEEEKKSTELEQGESADEIDRNSQEHDNRDSPAERPDLAKKTSNEVPVKLQEEEKKSTELEQGESADEIDRNSQEHDNRDSPAERPDLAKKTSNEVPVKLQEEEKKSTELEQGESADEIDRNSQEHDNRDSPAERPDLAKKTSNEVHENLEDEDRKSRPSTVKRPESGRNTLTEDPELLMQQTTEAEYS